MEGFRSRTLRYLFRLFPFNPKGDLELTQSTEKTLSCVINFYGRIHLLESILYSLLDQDLPRNEFEVILVEDRGGTEDGLKIAKRFYESLDIRYYCLNERFGLMGYSRNYGLSLTKGRFILFLDDDTVILQRNFLSTLINEFTATGSDGIIPRGMASYQLIKGRYGFHDPIFPSSRCMAYKREVLQELGGFIHDIIGQEDVEFTIRFIALNKRYHISERLTYLHPPLIMDNLNKAKAVGISFARLKGRYPFFIWLLLIVNGTRDIVKLLFPFNMKWRMQGRFGLGFLMGVIRGLSGDEIGYN